MNVKTGKNISCYSPCSGIQEVHYQELVFCWYHILRKILETCSSINFFRLTLFWTKRVRPYDSAENSIHKTCLFVSCHRQHFVFLEFIYSKAANVQKWNARMHHHISSVISPVTIPSSLYWPRVQLSFEHIGLPHSKLFFKNWECFSVRWHWQLHMSTKACPLHRVSVR